MLHGRWVVAVWLWWLLTGAPWVRRGGGRWRRDVSLGPLPSNKEENKGANKGKTDDRACATNEVPESA